MIPSSMQDLVSQFVVTLFETPVVTFGFSCSTYKGKE